MTMTLSGMLRLAAMSALSVALAIVVLGSVAHAQKAAEKRKAAEAALQTGLAAQKARKHKAAVGQFSKAIAIGGLSRKQMNYALYRRAVSFRAAKRPAQAISDLNSALYFVGDLSSSDRTAAIKERTRAFKDAGLKPTAVATASPQPTAIGPGPSSAKTATAGSSKGAKKIEPRRSLSTLPPTAPILGGPQTPVAGPPAKAASRSAQPAAVPAFKTRVSSAPRSRQPAKATATRSAPSRATSNWKVASTPQAATTPKSTTKSKGRPAVSSWSQPSVVRTNSTQAQTTQTSTGATTPVFGSVSKFFGNIFQSQPAAKPAAKPLITGNVTVTPSHVTPGRSAKTAVSKRVAPNRSAAGQYDISVAAIKSKSRADALAKKLMARYSSSLSWSGKKARVDHLPATAKRGELYAVKLGSYASKGETATQCEKLIADGFDCLVMRRN
jgi:SPOR domain